MEAISKIRYIFDIFEYTNWAMTVNHFATYFHPNEPPTNAHIVKSKQTIYLAKI